jgi:HAMP domain-containing protein
VGDVLLALGITFVVLAAAAMAAGGWLYRRLRRHNLVSRTYRGRAPLTWLASPATCARLHRRLRGAVAALRMVVPAPRRRRPAPAELAQLVTAADEVELHAATLDRDLLVASRLRGSAGRELRVRLARQVTELERVAARVTAAASAATPNRPGTQPSAAALRDLNDQLDALEAARDEVARLEARVGLA